MEHVTSADGTRIAYERSGSGPPLVLVHGTSVERFSFRLVAPLLEERFTLYAVDRRGRGESATRRTATRSSRSSPTSPRSSTRWRSPPTSSPTPYGASVALGAAPLARNLRRIVLYEPAPGIEQVDPELLPRLEALVADDDREQLLTVFFTSVGLDPDALVQLRASPVWPLRVAAAHTIPRELRAELGYRPDPEAFARLAVPVLLLLGTESPEWAQKGTDLVRSLLPQARVARLEGEGHVATMTAPDRVADEVARFLGE